jgi:hypothetical protein
MPTVLRQHDIPESLRSRSTLKADYIDLFTVAIEEAPDRSPEQWARATVEDVAGLGGQFLWRVILGLRLGGRSSPEHIGGWRVGDHGDGWIRLEAASWFMTAQVIVQVDEGRLAVATLVRYDRPFAALVWLPTSIVHRRALPHLLQSAVERASG